MSVCLSILWLFVYLSYGCLSVSLMSFCRFILCLFGYLSYDTGKPSFNDFKQAKITLPLIYSLSKVNNSKKSEIIKYLKNYGLKIS